MARVPDPMFLSVFDIFKLGVGPSSSHTMGPMTAAARFLDDLRGGAEKIPGAGQLSRLGASLHGSLAFTGKGHATDRAVILGLLGFVPDTLDPEEAERRLAALRETGRIDIPGIGPLAVDPEKGVVFDYGPPLPGHANGMVLRAFDAAGNLHLTETYYSVGGGFVVTERQLRSEAVKGDDARVTRPHPFATAAGMLAMGETSGLSIAAMKRANETAGGHSALDAGLDRLWQVMDACIDRGLATDGILPGGLKVRRRSRAIHQELLAERGNNAAQPHTVNDWLSVYAMAVNEENAAGGRVVTAPTNGAAGIVPAVLHYYERFAPKADEQGVFDFLLTAGAVGILYKENASISGAEVGCQGEVGVACSMAAAGLTAALGGTVHQVENAAEIGMEHNLGLTCDPIAGLVQIPCIERNAMGAVKAINASRMALRSDGTHYVSLDKVIKTMRDTGRDMQDKYKETSRGGLAVNVVEC